MTAPSGMIWSSKPASFAIIGPPATLGWYWRGARGRSRRPARRRRRLWRSRSPATAGAPSCGFAPSRQDPHLVPLWPRSGAQALQHVLAGFEIGVNVLDIVAVFERLKQLEQALRGVVVDRRRGFGTPAEPGRNRRPELLFERVPHRVEIVGRRDHDVTVGVALDIAGARLDRRFEHLIGARRVGGIGDLADMIEHESHAASFAERPAGLGEGGAHLAGGAVAIVGQRFDDDRHAARPVTFVAHLFISLAALGAGAAL